mmetsp:Transcript_54503/g.119323  ORF Transcript_54503/g.119323 Transcript_54503/m.119323 type:complete len:224 (-) Transcript_54503:620-1291(-)
MTSLRCSQLLLVVPCIHLELKLDSSVLLHILVEIRHRLVWHGTLLQADLVTQQCASNLAEGCVCHLGVRPEKAFHVVAAYKFTDEPCRPFFLDAIPDYPSNDVFHLFPLLGKVFTRIRDYVMVLGAHPRLLCLHVHVSGLIWRFMSCTLCAICAFCLLQSVELLSTIGSCDQMNDIVIASITQPCCCGSKLLLHHGPSLLSAVGHIVHNSTVEEDDSSTRRLW